MLCNPASMNAASAAWQIASQHSRSSPSCFGSNTRARSGFLEPGTFPLPSASKGPERNCPSLPRWAASCSSSMSKIRDAMYSPMWPSWAGLPTIPVIATSFALRSRIRSANRSKPAALFGFVTDFE